MDGLDSISGGDLAEGFAGGLGTENSEGGQNNGSEAGDSGDVGGNDLGLSMNMSEEEAYGASNVNNANSDLGLSMNMSEEEAYGSSSVNNSGNDLGLSMNMSEEEAYGSEDSMDGIQGNGMIGNDFGENDNSNDSNSDLGLSMNMSEEEAVGSSSSNNSLSPESLELANPDNPAFADGAMSVSNINPETAAIMESMQNDIAFAQTDITTAGDILSAATGRLLGTVLGAVTGGTIGALGGSLFGPTGTLAGFYGGAARGGRIGGRFGQDLASDIHDQHNPDYGFVEVNEGG